MFETHNKDNVLMIIKMMENNFICLNNKYELMVMAILILNKVRIPGYI